MINYRIKKSNANLYYVGDNATVIKTTAGDRLTHESTFLPDRWLTFYSEKEAYKVANELSNVTVELLHTDVWN